MNLIIFALAPLILSMGISPVIPFSDAAESNQICVDKVWIENSKGKIACVTSSTADKLVQRGWGTLLSGNVVDGKHADSASSLPEDVAISIKNDDNAIVAPDQIACQIDSYADTDLETKLVPVNIMNGNGKGPKLTSVIFDGVTVMVKYSTGEGPHQMGDSRQTFLAMTMNDESGLSTHSVLYDYRLKMQSGPINVLHLDTLEKQVRLQCWIPN